MVTPGVDSPVGVGGATGVDLGAGADTGARVGAGSWEVGSWEVPDMAPNAASPTMLKNRDVNAMFLSNQRPLKQLTRSFAVSWVRFGGPQSPSMINLAG